MSNRGAIYNKEKALQVNNFEGLKFGKITPTDMDGFIDFGDKIFIFLEGKHKDVPMPYGQKLAFERLCSAADKAGKFSVILLANHDIDPPADVNFDTLPVVKYYHKGEWRTPKTPITVKQSIDKILKINSYSLKE
jgi:hypothetical protein